MFFHSLITGISGHNCRLTPPSATGNATHIETAIPCYTPLVIKPGLENVLENPINGGFSGKTQLQMGDVPASHGADYQMVMESFGIDPLGKKISIHSGCWLFLMNKSANLFINTWHKRSLAHGMKWVYPHIYWANIASQFCYTIPYCCPAIPLNIG